MINRAQQIALKGDVVDGRIHAHDRQIARKTHGWAEAQARVVQKKPVSEAQRRWAWANKDKDPAAAEFAAKDPGGKLPAHVEDGKPKKKGDGFAHVFKKSYTAAGVREGMSTPKPAGPYVVQHNGEDIGHIARTKDGKAWAAGHLPTKVEVVSNAPSRAEALGALATAHAEYLNGQNRTQALQGQPKKKIDAKALELTLVQKTHGWAEWNASHKKAVSRAAHELKASVEQNGVRDEAHYRAQAADVGRKHGVPVEHIHEHIDEVGSNSVAGMNKWGEMRGLMRSYGGYGS